MNLPVLSAPMQRTRGTKASLDGVNPSSCSIWKKIGCAAAIAACAPSCVAPPACSACLEAIGMSGCFDCFF